jgi:hypothetical protein
MTPGKLMEKVRRILACHGQLTATSNSCGRSAVS